MMTPSALSINKHTCQSGSELSYRLSYRYWLKIAFVSFLALAVLSACGFKLRGAISLPYKYAMLNGTMTLELRQGLTRAIEVGSNVKMTANPKEADLIINILQDQATQQILTYNISGQITSYRLIMVVKFNVSNKDGEELIPDSDVYMMRDMDFSISSPLAAEMLTAELNTSMRADIINQILRRIAALQKSKPVVQAQ